MGKPVIPELLRAIAGHDAPTPLLAHLAGEHAPRVAMAWPAPHLGFLTLPAARRHAAAMLLERVDVRGSGNIADIVALIERARDAEVAAAIIHHDTPGGLMKALGRCGETLWTVDEYRTLRRLFAAETTMRVLRHMPELRPVWLARIDLLPGALRTANIVTRLPDNAAAIEDLATAWTLALRIHGATEAPKLIARWDRAETPMRLFDMAADALVPAAFGAPVVRPALGEGFTRVDDRKALEAVAFEFQNCLRNYVAAQATGRMCVFVWTAGDPPVVFALRHDVAGWRLAEAKLKGNEDVSDDALRTLIARLDTASVRTGEDADRLRRRLHEHVCTNCGPAYIPPRNTWRERLALGDYND